jgi:hypothetical protein
VQQLAAGRSLSLAASTASSQLKLIIINGQVWETVVSSGVVYQDQYYIHDGHIQGAPDKNWSYLFPESDIAKYFGAVTVLMRNEIVGGSPFGGSPETVPVGQDYTRLLGDAEIGGTLTVGMGLVFGPVGAVAGGVAAFPIIDIYQNDPAAKKYSGFGFLFCGWMMATTEFDGYILGSSEAQKAAVMTMLGCN